MSETTTTSWTEANQRYLTAELRRVRLYFERAGGARPPSDEEAVGDELRKARAALPELAALDALCQAFGLSTFERDVLLLCAGVELEATFAALVASVQDKGTSPTFELALAVLPEAHWSALTPGAALRRWRLVELGSGERLVSNPFRIDERVLHYLTGVSCPDEQLSGFVQPVNGTSTQLAPSQAALADQVTSAWKAGTSPTPVVQLIGSSSSEKRAVAAAAAARVGMALHVMAAEVVPAGTHERDVLMRLWEREAILSRSALLIEADQLSGDAERIPFLRQFLENTQAVLLLGGRTRLTLAHRASLSFEVRKPTAAEQHSVWTSLLGDRAGALNGQIDRLSGHFDLSVPTIEATCRHVLASLEEDSRPQNAFSAAPEDYDKVPTPVIHEERFAESTGLAAHLWEACRSQARPQLSDLAQPIVPVATWDDLVLPELQTRTLREIAIHVRRRMTVYEMWGFAAKSSRGLGISALFAGPSGTGKTMAAEVLAGALRLDLYRIDLSRVVSKYIGETEKNLARVFDAAEEGGAILLFDEADALFGKRSEVKDSHDRYANIETSYLLQRMEAYRGLAILTTNLKNAIDDAFLRRLRFVVTFPFPDAIQRAAIWRRIFPAETPTEGLDPDKLARLNVTGGNIRNIAMNAAFLAADADTPVRPEHVQQAARTEYAKLERPLTDSEIRVCS